MKLRLGLIEILETLALVLWMESEPWVESGRTLQATDPRRQELDICTVGQLSRTLACCIFGVRA
jgi:hypothetical protein